MIKELQEIQAKHGDKPLFFYINDLEYSDWLIDCEPVDVEGYDDEINIMVNWAAEE